MYRFMNSKKLFARNASSLSGRPSEMYYARTCSLCNRVSSFIPVEGYAGSHRFHSTWLSPERKMIVFKKKKYKISSSIVRAKPRQNSVQKTRITILNPSQCEKEEENTEKSFLTSSSSSSLSVFSSSQFANIGVTIMFPPNATDKNLSESFSKISLDPLASHEVRSQMLNEDQSSLSLAAAELLLRGSSINRLIAQNFAPPSRNNELQEMDVANSTAIQTSINESKDLLEETARSYGRQDNAGSLPDSNSGFKKSKKQQLEDYLLASRVDLSKLKRIIHRSSYIDVCANSGKIDQALLYAQAGLKYFTDSPYQNRLMEPLICHAVLEQDMQQLHSLLTMAKSFNVKLSLNSYLVCLELLGRLQKSDDSLEITKILLKAMENEGIKVDNVLESCQGRGVLMNKVIQAVQNSDPQFKPAKLPGSSYSTSVLSSLNDSGKSKAERYFSPVSGLMSGDSVDNLVDEQIALHDSGVALIKNIACTLGDLEIKKYLEVQKKISESWKKSIIKGFQDDLRGLGSKKSNFHLANYLCSLPVETFADIIIQEVQSRICDSDKQSIGLLHAQREIGKRIKLSYDRNILEKYGIVQQARDAHVAYCKWYAEPDLYPPGPSTPRGIWEHVVEEKKYDDSFSTNLLREWTNQTLENIGKFMYNILLKNVKIHEHAGLEGEEGPLVPALYIVFRKTTKGYQKQLKMHPAVHRVFPTKMQPYLNMSAYELPMVCPPRPWISVKSGVYPLSSPQFQRAPETLSGEQSMAENVESVPTQQLYPCMDSLNQLSSVPWKVNKPVLEVVTEVFNSGGSEILSIPKPPSLASPEPTLPENASVSERVQVSKARARVRQENAEMYSLWCDTLYKLCIAHEFKDRIFWLPHNMDFRGRVYPICPHLQHMSNDMARSLLSFARGEKLGSDGLMWLKLHTINLTGQMSKDSLSARLAYAEEIMPKILDSAERPLTGDKWWMKSEDPWQTLAACIEIATALKSGDPENFVSHFPVHQDGSCNGLQHYAALGRDTLGAKSVNLVDTERPSDVYLCVSDSVEMQRAKDASEGNALAQSLEGFICRKVVKQTVMTTVYGVTQYGAQLQIQGRLKDLDYPREKVKVAAAYITKLVFQSLGEMFTSSRNIQDWLTQCAAGVVKSKLSPVKWVTPLGLPVIQPYFKGMNKKTVVGNIPKELWINIIMRRMPISQKNKNAFSPNFIHSLDSCHMMMTGLHCEQSNITFVSVHDCYWVHAQNVSNMSEICREQFVALHSEPILEDLSKFLIETFCLDESVVSSPAEAVKDRHLRRIFSAVPPKGDFNLQEVLKSKYFFS